MASASRLWFQNRIASLLTSIRQAPKSERVKRWARYGGVAVAAAGLIAGGLSYSPSFRRHATAYVLPALTLRTNYITHHRKQSLFQSLHGRVLELGPGTGANFAYFPSHIAWTGVDSNPEVLPALYASAAAAGTPPPLLDVHIQPLIRYLREQPSNSVDAVVSTYVLCSTADYSDALQHIHRVLKPGGRFYFVEPVAREDGSIARTVQNIINPLYRMLSGGCNLTHETDKAIAAVGFDRIATEWWTQKSDWPAAHARVKEARAQTAYAAYAQLQQSKGDPNYTPPPPPKRSAAATAPSGSVSKTASGTKPVIAGIAVKKASARPVSTATAAAPNFNYGLFSPANAPQH